MILNEQLLQLIALLCCHLQRWLPCPIQHLECRRSTTCHLLRYDILRMVLITQHNSPLIAQRRHLNHDRPIIKLISICASLNISTIQLLAQITPRRVGQEWYHGCWIERHHPTILQPPALRLRMRLTLMLTTQPVEILRSQRECEVIAVGYHVRRKT